MRQADQSHRYWGVFWLDAISNATVDKAYVNIGRRCGRPSSTADDVKSWLACNTNRWLLIIDNADDPEIDYSQHIPRTKNGDVLLTSRNTECLVHQTVGSERLEDLESDLARQLLVLHSGVDQTQWEEETKTASAVVNVLGSHTLAIIQACAFIKRKLCTLHEYPAIFENEKGDMLRYYSKQNMSVYRNVYTTFEVSARHLERCTSQDSVDALNLLHISAFL